MMKRLLTRSAVWAETVFLTKVSAPQQFESCEVVKFASGFNVWKMMQESCFFLQLNSSHLLCSFLPVLRPRIGEFPGRFFRGLSDYVNSSLKCLIMPGAKR